MLDAIFSRYPISAVIHFAGLKAVGESVAKPLLYYENNVYATLSLLKAMERAHCKRMVFSSSATVYGDPKDVPIDEQAALAPTNPYGWSKAMIEQALKDLAASDPEWKLIALRYFNPVGAHESGLIGEDPAGIPNNLLPYIAQVAIGKLARLKVHGNDYPTRDGTGERDYIHVTDLARGHLAALSKIESVKSATAINLGTGVGTTVLEMLHAFEQASGTPMSYEIGPRRPGDIASCYADPSLASEFLGWRAEHAIDRMCLDSWRWQKQNPNGYE
jgi:UDP-glucose 4-epimerase